MRLVFATLLLGGLAACDATGGGPTPAGSTADGSPSAGVSTQPPEALPTVSGTPMEYVTTTFELPFTVTVPPGWIVAERDVAGAQIYRDCTDCPEDGQDNGEVTIDTTMADQSLEEAIAELADAPGLEAGDVTPVEVGDLSGLMFTGTRAGQADITFRTSGYHTSPFGEPLKVYVVAVGGETVMLIVDPHLATGDAAEAFYEVAADILESLRFQQ